MTQGKAASMPGGSHRVKESWMEPGALLLVRQNARAGSCGGCPQAKLNWEQREESPLLLLLHWQAVQGTRSWQAARESGPAAGGRA